MDPAGARAVPARSAFDGGETPGGSSGFLQFQTAATGDRSRAGAPASDPAQSRPETAGWETSAPQKFMAAIHVPISGAVPHGKRIKQGSEMRDPFSGFDIVRQMEERLAAKHTRAAT